MKILNKYIIKEHLSPFIMSLSVLILILLAQFLLKHMDKFLGKGLNISILFEMVYYNMAWVMALAVPMAILVSTLMAFGRLSNDNEILAMRSSGITYLSMLSPALIFAIAISLIMIYFNNWILPDMNYKARNLISNISKKNPDILFQEGQLHNELDGYIIYFESKDPKSGKFKNTTIVEHNNKITKTITSKYAELIEDYNDDLISLYLEDGFIYEKSKKENEYRTIEFENNIIRIDANNFSLQRRTTKYRGDRELVFDSIKVKIDSFDKKIAKSKKRIKDRILIINPNYITESPDSALKFIKDELNKLSAISATKENINAMKRSLKNIERGIKHDKAQIESNSRLKNKYIVELHKKFSIPIASIVFVFAGAPLGIIARRGKFSISMAISLIFFLIYWAFLIAGEEFADQGRINPILSMWLPNIILFIIGLFLNIKTINEMKRIKIFKMKRNKDV